MCEETSFDCCYCNRAFKNNNALRTHIRFCKNNPNHTENPFVKWNKTHTVWNKGKTKENDERVKRQAEKVKELFRQGKLSPKTKGLHPTEETRQKISNARKEYLKKHPDKVPYVLNHHRNGDSYPERYFRQIFETNGISFEKDYRCLSYFLDFAFVESKTYIEIDGEQHYLDKRIVQHDKIRTKKLEDNGWKCLCRIRWSEYKIKSEEEKKKYIENLLEKIRSVCNDSI